ncbi:MAG: phosphatidylserine decarboxylase [Acidobacteria bacterium]|jgi:phosphatidylserine decarboxylase|nr:phosphatidylserine decarboxylase [Acidobacteriota bacterium]
MKIDHAALPFVLMATAPAAGLWWLWGPVVGASALVLPVAIGLFFRDPDRTCSQDPSLVLSPADGTVMYAGPALDEDAPIPAPADGPWQQITIFLSLFDVHINRTPVSGQITQVRYERGTFLPAYKAESSRNERSEIWFDHQGTTIVARQVVGILARRVVCRLAVGQQVDAGAHLGLMKFGSRMDVFVPSTATLIVAPAQKVRAGEAILARLSA